MLASAGVAVLVEGAIVAWRANSATPLIVAGAVLAALGLFNWREFRIGRGEWWMAFSLLTEAKKLHDLSEREGIPEEARRELAEAAHTVAAISATGPTGPGGPGESVPWARRRSTRGYHRYIDGGRVIVGVSASPTSRYKCVITQPDGSALSAQPKRIDESFMAPVEATFPDDFLDAPKPPAHGRYRVDWYARSAIMIFNAPPQNEHVGHDEFELPPSAADALGLT